MKPRVAILAASLAVAGISFSALPAAAQNAPAVPQSSPSARVEQQIGLTKVAVAYSSPGVKDRKIFGGLVPFDKVWRTGANGVTTFESSRDFKFGGKEVPAGTYALHTIPGKSSWTVILNSDVNAWGSYSYDQKKDVIRIQVKPETMPALRERMTFLFSDATDNGAKLDFEWEKVRVRIPVEVDTNAHVLAGIESALNDAWRPHFTSARWLLESNGDLKKALEYADASIAIKPTWWNHWIKAQILGKT
ncbi:MAG: DUF2911 domain-containing protein, partial [Myxococcaceae bacterium]